MTTFIFLATCVVLSYTASELRQLHVRSRPTTLRGLEDVPVSPGDKSEKWTTGFVMRKPEGVLYYEILKRMRYRNLIFSDIQEVLSQKDADQFTFTLADKLGYLVDNKYDDPHIPVIKSHKEDLMALLEKKQSKYSNPPSQQSKQESIATTNPPVPVSDDDNADIGIEVIKAIHSLTPEASDELVDFVFIPDSLPRAVGLAIGYSEGDEHMKYLKNMDEIVLRTIVQHTLASKTPSKNGPSFDKQGTEQQTSEEDGDEDGPMKGPTRGPKQGTRVLVGDGVPGLGQSDLDKAKPGKENDELHESSVGLSSTTNPSLGVAIPVPAQTHLYTHAKGRAT